MKEILKAAEKNRKLIFDTERYIWKNPETGYREVKTNAYLKKIFEKLGYEVKTADGITGFYTVLDTKRPGATILIMAELDSIICSTHPEADKETGAVHSCGHNAQCAGLVGIAAALKEPGILDKFSGKIKLCAVPAEELLEIEYRRELINEGKIKYFGGKPEFLSRGYFDDVDVAFMVHTTTGDKFRITDGSVGCRAKTVIYKGTAAHAGGAPHLGKNALYAATCGLNAVNAIRETFIDEDHVRVHPIITHGGDMVNAIPEQVEIESYVRARSFDAIDSANAKVNRAFIGAALSLGANIKIIDAPGYAPHINCKELRELTRTAIDLTETGIDVEIAGIAKGSTDNGDLAAVMPVIQPYAPGAVGISHGSNYYIEDPEKACVASAKLQLALLYLLAEDNGKRALEIKKSYKPAFPSIKAYLDYMDSCNTSGNCITYNGDGTVSVTLK